MRLHRLAAAAFLAATPALAAVVATHSGDPAKYADAADRNTDADAMVGALESHLRGLGARLPAGTDVTIEILDMDRAGRTPGNMTTKLRVMKVGGGMPCIDLRYTVEAGGRRGEPTRERVCDADYLRPLGLRYDEHDPLAYDKRMIDEWFAKRFIRAEARR